MQTITQLIKAVGTGYQAAIGGQTFLLQACDAGNVLTLTLTNKLGHRYVAAGIGPGFKVRPIAGFTDVSITTSADANVAFIVSDGDVDMQNGQVNSLIVNTAANPVHVSIDGGSVTLNATNVGINNTTANPVPVQLHTTDITLPVSLAALPALPAGANAIGTVGVTALPALPAGANAIGTVGVTALPALPAGANTIGTVNVVDAVAARALAGKGFAAIGTAPAVAGNYSQVMLWNPAGSGVSLFVEQISCMALGTNQGYLITSAAAAGGALYQAGMNKLLGGAVGKGAAYNSAVAALPGGPYLGALDVGSGGAISYPQAEPIIVPPGYGLVVTSELVNTVAQITFEWYEQ